MQLSSTESFELTAMLPAAGTSVVWKYQAIDRLNDEQVGQWSDVASINVMG